MSSFTPIKDRIEYGGAYIGEEEKAAINRVIDSQGGRRWTIGPESEGFEQELAHTTGVDKAIVVNSGSSALLVAITAMKLPKGSKVIIPAVNFPTAFNALLQCNLLPVVVDVDPATLNLSLREVTKALELYPDITAVIAIDIAGNPVDLVSLRDIVGDRKILLDDCDGYGTTLHGKFVETYADIAAVSFHAAHIITTGEGGAVLTSNKAYADSARKLREWGRASGTDKIYEYPGLPDDYKERYVYEEIGYNLKPLELQCAMGRIQLTRLPFFKQRRAENYALMLEVFKNNPLFTMIEVIPDSEPCWFSFPLICNGIKRGKVMQTLEDSNIECRTIFSGNIIRHPAYKDSTYLTVGDLANADNVMTNGMFLSVHPSITPDMITFIRKVVSEL